MAAMCAAIVARAVKGDLEAAKWIADRVDGRVAQAISVESQQTVNVVPWLPAILHGLQESVSDGEPTHDGSLPAMPSQEEHPGHTPQEGAGQAEN